MNSMSLILAFILMKTPAVQEAPPVRNQIPVEVVQVLDLPINITDAALVKTKDGYLLKCGLVLLCGGSYNRNPDQGIPTVARRKNESR